MIVSDVLIEIEQAKSRMEFIPTGWKKVDTALSGGFLRGEIVVIGGATGFGKSFVASQLMLNIARTSGFKCAYFSLEISNRMIVSRMLGSLTNIHPVRIMTGQNISPTELESLKRGEAILKAHDEYFDLYDLVYNCEAIEKIVEQNKYECVIVDFIQNVIAPGDEYARLSTIALKLQQLARRTNACIIVLSQLSNSSAREKGDQPVAEYKGSGSIGMIADLGFFLRRGDPETGYDVKLSLNDLSLNLVKNRRGEAGKYFKLSFVKPGGGIIEYEGP